MNKRTRNIILLIVILQVFLIGGLLALPTAVQAIPGRYRVALAERYPSVSEMAEGVIERVAPVATALPAPAAAQASAEEVDLGALIGTQVEPTAVPTVPPTSTPEPTVAAVEETAVDATPLPTATVEPTPTIEPIPELPPRPAQVRLEGIEPVRQTFNNCGPSNLVQVMNFHGSTVTQEEVAAYLKPNPEDRNVSPWQIADYVNETTFGQFKAGAYAGGNMEMIKQFVAAGLPVVIEKGYYPNVDNAPGWWGHYLTVFGYDDDKEEMYSLDTYLGPFDGSGRVDSYEEIELYWQQFNYTFYVVYEPQQEALVNQILGSEMLDEFTMWRNAAAVAEQQTREEPDNAFSWFNVGTNLTQLGELTGEQQYYQGGAQAFDRAREIGLPPRMLWYQFRPYYAYLKTGRYQDIVDLANATLETQGGRNVEETYWHKGHALVFLGDIAGAAEAYREALRANPNFYPAQISLDSIGG
ncbi:MAG: C39 family peptidase [Anaerolineales bacterium]|nr:C39 family peptidase [Anaerolineales bacterium]